MDEQPTAASEPAEPTLDEVRAQFPDWQCNHGVNDLFYAQHAATGTQVTGEDPADLRDQIKAAQSRHAATPPGTAGPLYQWGQM